MKTIILSLVAALSMAQDFGPLHPAMAKSTRGPVRGGMVGGWNLGSVNLLKYSEDFSNAVWGVLGPNWGAWIKATVTADQSASPNGDNTADLITSTHASASGIGASKILCSAGQVYTVSAYMKNGTADTVFLGFAYSNDGTNRTGTLDSDQIALTSILTRYSYTFTVPAGATSCQPWIEMSSGSGKTIYAWGFQLNKGSTALPYVATTDLQTVPNIVAGGAALTLGSTSGADANDPTRTLSGMVFAGSHKLTGPLSRSDQAMTIMAVASTANSSVVPGRDGVVVGLRSTEVEAPLDLGYSLVRLLAQIRSGNTWYSQSSVINHVANSVHTLTTIADAGRLAAYHSIDGVTPVKIEPFTSGPLANSTGITVGSGFYGGPVYYSGTISYVLIYNRALSPKEIRQNHQWLKSEMAKVGVSLP